MKKSRRSRLYYVIYAVLEDHEYRRHAAYDEKHDEDQIIETLKAQYGDKVRIESIDEFDSFYGWEKVYPQIEEA